MFARRRGAGESDAAREIRNHLDLELEDLRASGLSKEEASYAAMRKFGNTTLIAEACREIGGRGSMARMRADLKEGFRGLIRRPGYAAVAVVTLALGVAANAVIFSIVSAVLLRPLPYPNAPRIVTVLHGGKD